jgi:hypothetical protein
MKPDPMDQVEVIPARRVPPRGGPGSGKAAWVEFALDQVNNGAALWRVIEDQSATIRALNGEIELLRSQIERRKPKGGRPRTPDDKLQAIEADIARGLSRREAAKRNGVSPMTVVRVSRRAEAREA